jgi:hypothetical protein
VGLGRHAGVPREALRLGRGCRAALGGAWDGAGGSGPGSRAPSARGRGVGNPSLGGLRPGVLRTQAARCPSARTPRMPSGAGSGVGTPHWRVFGRAFSGRGNPRGLRTAAARGDGHRQAAALRHRGVTSGTRRTHSSRRPVPGTRTRATSSTTILGNPTPSRSFRGDAGNGGALGLRGLWRYSRGADALGVPDVWVLTRCSSDCFVLGA